MQIQWRYDSLNPWWSVSRPASFFRLALATFLAPSAFGSEPFAYAGIGLDATAASLKARFPNSKLAGNTLTVAPKDSRDHVYGVELAAPGIPRTVRISFERPAGGGGGPAAAYPKCKVLEARLRAANGAADEIRKAPEARPPRADRVWKRDRQTLTLICFAGPGGESLAEAVVIVER